MPTLKSREPEYPETMIIALANMSIAQKNLLQLTRALRHQASLFESDVIQTILNNTADDIETHTETVNEIREELIDFMSGEEK